MHRLDHFPAYALFEHVGLPQVSALDSERSDPRAMTMEEEDSRVMMGAHWSERVSVVIELAVPLTDQTFRATISYIPREHQT
jgi:hypothetical protein